MPTLEQRLEDADRLAMVTHRVGFTLWQLQELEGAAAQFFVLVAQAKLGMGAETGDLLLDKAQRNTFGATVRRIADAGLIDARLEKRLRALLDERNWLVHKSRSESRNAVRADASAHQLIDRLDAMAAESNAILEHIAELAERHVLSHGVTREQIKEVATRMLEEWHASDDA